MRRETLPPSGVNLTALLIMFTKTWESRCESPTTRSCFTLLIFTLKFCFFFWICGWRIVIKLSIVSERLNSSSDNTNFPLSILDISKTSFIRPKRCLLETVILLRQSIILGVSSICIAAIDVIPIMAFIGVLISWDICERKSLLAWLAASADL